MRPKKLFCHNRSSGEVRSSPVSLGVPFAEGELHSLDSLCLKASDATANLPLQSSALALWPSGSVKWALLDFFADIPAEATSEYLVRSRDGDDVEQPHGVGITRQEESWLLDTGAALFELDTRQFRPFRSVEVKGCHYAVPQELRFRDADGEPCVARIDEFSCETNGPVRCTIVVKGAIGRGADRLLNFAARMHFYTGSAKVGMEFRLHNPRAATHPDGLWDLGDPNSILFQEMTFHLPLPPSDKHELFIQPNFEQPLVTVDTQAGASLYQESSGGPQWNSPVHKNRQGKVVLEKCGFELRQGEVTKETGTRAQPFLWWRNGVADLSVTIEHFWQKFPKGVSASGDGLQLNLFPAEFPDLHELQAGEQISHRLFFDYDVLNFTETPFGSSDLLDIRLDKEAYKHSGACKDFAWQKGDTLYRKLVAGALDEQQGFYAKREQIDEYGWRNFGDLYADHEAAFHKEETLFVSHYNNQYDPLYSFYRQFIQDGDHRWQQLAEELADHIADIDINHTEEDREEYSNGPFWHTDHYLDAATSTHRMASKAHHLKKNPLFCGGGPGAEHCYTSGLRLHYLMTGDPRFKGLVLSLADWCFLNLRGPRTFLAFLLRTKRTLLTFVRAKGNNCLWPRFPLTRGTGNCLKASLDALEVSNDRYYLDRATFLIRNTVHPKDPLLERNLLDAEIAWSYSVFLVSVAYYLMKKVELQEIDADYGYALRSYLHYARWMAEHEYPFLENTEILEFPNETWAGQDLRKGLIFFYAAHMVEGVAEQQTFLEKARFFLHGGFEELQNWESCTWTRPLVLLLQNGWAADKLAVPLQTWPQGEPWIEKSESPRLGIGSICQRIVTDLKETLAETSLKREYSWLAARLKKT